MLKLDDVLITEAGFSLAADWEAPEGGILALIGPSGAGKSTLLAVISGFLAPDRGRVLWRGQDLTGLPPGGRPVSILFQDNNLFPHLGVAQNVGLGLRPDLRLSDADRRAIADVLATVGLSGAGDRKPGSLSGGQQSRVALARVLVSGRPLVLMDEPFAALGPAQRREMLALARQVLAAKGQTLVLVTHDPQEARAADRVVVVADGVASAPIASEPAFANPSPALAAYLGEAGQN